jgi:hypothetical protein
MPQPTLASRLRSPASGLSKNHGKVGQVALFALNPNAPRTSNFAIDGKVAPVILVISLDPAQLEAPKT